LVARPWYFLNFWIFLDFSWKIFWGANGGPYQHLQSWIWVRQSGRINAPAAEA